MIKYSLILLSVVWVTFSNAFGSQGDLMNTDEHIMTQPKDAIHLLFVCTGNACRSQMAEGLARELSKEAKACIFVESAGIVAHGINPTAIDMMKEVGIDISSHTSKILTRKMLDDADIIITLCGSADESCPKISKDKTRLHWPFFDPAKAEGTAEEILNKFRDVRNGLKEMILKFFENL